MQLQPETEIDSAIENNDWQDDKIKLEATGINKLQGATRLILGCER